MIPQFKDYITLNESKEQLIFKDIEINKRGYSYGQIKGSFLARNYQFLGTLFIGQAKYYSRWNFTFMTDQIPEDMLKKMENCENYSDYLYHTINTYNADWSTTVEEGEKHGDFHKVLESDNIDKITACYTKTDKLFYVLWNEQHKYFYFLRIKDDATDGIKGFMDLWIKVRTLGKEDVQKKVDKIYDDYIQDLEQKRKEKEERESDEIRERMLKFVKQKDYERRAELIWQDVQAHPENYESVRRDKLPKEILDDINSDSYDVKYVEYIKHGKWDPYDVEHVTCYINDDDLTKGYKYTAGIDHAEPGTYWGD